MIWLLASMLLLLLSGGLCWLPWQKSRTVLALKIVLNLIAASCGLNITLRVLFSGVPESWEGEIASYFPWIANWQCDTLSAYFCIPPLVFAGLISLTQLDNLISDSPQARAARWWMPVNCLLAGMLLLCVTRQPLSLALTLEGMLLSISMCLVVCAERAKSRGEIWQLFLVPQVSLILLFVTFQLWHQAHSVLHWLQWQEFRSSIVFALCVIACLLLGGFFPCHKWLVAVRRDLSEIPAIVVHGVMQLLAVYGMLRVLELIGPQEKTFNMSHGSAMIVLGIAGALSGAWQALQQFNLARLFAKINVLQQGILLVSLGLGLLGCATPIILEGEATGSVIALVGFGGALLQAWNVALIHTLLLLVTAAVHTASGTTDLPRLGGLATRLPLTTSCAAIGCLAAAGLPPLNGFVGMFLPLYGALQEEIHALDFDIVPALTILAGLSLAGGMGALALAKAFGCGFLGSPRVRSLAPLRETGGFFNIVLLAPVVGCIGMAILSPQLIVNLQPALGALSIPAPRLHLAAQVQEVFLTLEIITLSSVLLAVVSFSLMWGRWLLLGEGRAVKTDDADDPHRSLRQQASDPTFIFLAPWLEFERHMRGLVSIARLRFVISLALWLGIMLWLSWWLWNLREGPP